MPPAAAVPVKNNDGIGQNAGLEPYSPIVATAMKASARNELPKTPAPIRPDCCKHAGYTEVPAPLVVSIGGRPPQQHANRANSIGNGRHQPCHYIRQTNPLNDLRQEEGDAVCGGDNGEIDQGKYEHARVGEGLKKAEVPGALDLTALVP